MLQPPTGGGIIVTCTADLGLVHCLLDHDNVEQAYNISRHCSSTIFGGDLVARRRRPLVRIAEEEVQVLVVVSCVEQIKMLWCCTMLLLLITCSLCFSFLC
jgi:hypothetical protein